MPEELDDILEEFITEANELLESVDNDLLALEECPNDKEILNQIFRNIHTIKGNAAFFGLDALRDFTHKVENVFDALRNNELQCTPQLMDVVLESIDIIKRQVNAPKEKIDTEENLNKLIKILESKGKEGTTETKEEQVEQVIEEHEEDTQIENSQYLEAFITEAKEFVQRLSECLIELEKEPTRPILDEIFRVAHTLKGMAASLHLDSISSLTHQMENVLDKLRQDLSLVNNDIVDILFKCLDTLESLISNVGKKEFKSISTDELKQELSNILNSTTNLSQPKQIDNLEIYTENELNILKQAIKENKNCFLVEITLTKDCPMKSVRALIIIKEIEEIASIVKTIPSNNDLMEEKFEQTFKIVIITESSLQELQNKTSDLSEVQNVKIEKIELPLEKEIKKEEPKKEEVPKLKEQPKVKEEVKAETKPKAPSTQSKQGENLEIEQTIRIEVERLDNLMDWVGELVIAKNRLLRLANKIEEVFNHSLTDDLISTSSQISYAITELHQAVLKTRMLPIKKVFSKFPRMVRDLSRETKKEVELIIQGEETELDKSVIEKIGDPLVHILRNAVDHGIEKPEIREQKGKPRKGTIKLSAAHEGNHIIIEIIDDGKGMDPVALIKKAIEKNVITEDEASRLSDKEALNLIFAPGFSTAEVVSNISGRGVGMNVVKANIEQLGGIVDIDTQVGVGTTFKIKLPLTLAIIPALLVKVGQEIFAIPLSYVLETNRIHKDEIYTIDKKEVLYLRDSVISLIRLSDLFNIEVDNSFERYYSIILGLGQQKIGILVDDLVGQEDIVVKPLGELFDNTPLVAGATIMGDGNVVLIIDVNAILQNFSIRKKNRVC